MPNINTVRVYAHGAWANLIHTFPQGNIDDHRRTMACSDPGNAVRPQQFVKGQNYYIRYLINGTNNEEKWDGECEYEAGGSAPVQFGELDMLD